MKDIQRRLELALTARTTPCGPVECLGKTFVDDDARRAYFTDRLREKLADPQFRKTPGFPTASDEAILRLSNPPFYTACPNPFLLDFVRVHGKAFHPNECYEREPLAVDVSVGKTDQLYRAHAYHTKVPHLAIVPSILHYTRPGDIVLDGFCGTGMTGVAAQWCGLAPAAYRHELELECVKDGRSAPEWGPRYSVLGDLAPAATFIAAGYCLPFDMATFTSAARGVLARVEQELGWMYRTLHTDGKTECRINYTVWSEVFSCPECAGEVNFVEEALDSHTGKVADVFHCPHCGAEVTKKTLDKRETSAFDSALAQTVRTWKRVPVLINYDFEGCAVEKSPAPEDLALLQQIQSLGMPSELPVDRMMHAPETDGSWGDKWRAGTAAFTHVHHLLLPRSAQTLAMLWSEATGEKDGHLRNALLFVLDQIIWTASILNRYRPASSFGNGPLKGIYYVSSQVAEANVLALAEGALARVIRGLSGRQSSENLAVVTTGDCASMDIPADSIDYIFTDPPFGKNFAYAELNFIVEAWHRVFTEQRREAIVSPYQRKDVIDYQTLMFECFNEYYRVLKPGRWMTVVFSNSSTGVWRAIQEGMGTAGFVVADVRTLDKQQGTFNQVHGVTPGQDLVLSAYKPTAAMIEKFCIGSSTPEDAWSFVSEHLRHVPVFVAVLDLGDVILERTAHMLYDRMVAFHVQRHFVVPVSMPDFLSGLAHRYPERDGMYFLPTQVAEYDKKRARVCGSRQPELFVCDEVLTAYENPTKSKEIG